MIKSCANCHDWYWAQDGRGNSKTCSPECAAQRHKRQFQNWVAVNKAHVRAEQRRRRTQNKPQIAEQLKRWRAANRTRVQTLMKKWRTENRDRTQATRRAWRNANRERINAEARQQWARCKSERLTKKRALRNRAVDRLSDGYVRETLVNGSALSAKDIPAELVELQRAKLKLHRSLKQT